MNPSIAPRELVDRLWIGVDSGKIRTLRIRAKLTQHQAALRAGLSTRQKWNDIERGRRPVTTIELLERIAAALGVRAKDLLK
jgi:transcriptional regulator with XRE-family HTH domain